MEKYGVDKSSAEHPDNSGHTKLASQVKNNKEVTEKDVRPSSTNSPAGKAE